MTGANPPRAVDVPRSRCGDPSYASTREWLVTNGTGSYASGTIDGALTRRYHGLLVAALRPPAGRRLLVAKLADSATFEGRTEALTTDRWGGDAGAPTLRALAGFRLDGSVPVWTFAFGDALLERRVTMVRGRDATVVRYTLVRGDGPLTIEAKAIVADRDYHASERTSDAYTVDAPSALTVRIRTTWSGSRATWIRASAGTLEPEHTWYLDYALPREAARGLDAAEDHLYAATARFTLALGESALLEVASDTAEPPPLAGGPDPFDARRTYDAELLRLRAAAVATGGLARPEPTAVGALVLAADAFVVSRPLDGMPDGRTILAGYHWFGEWGRDAAIALPGLLLATGRRDVARAVLSTFGRHLDGGMLPNDVPNDGPPGYNSVDAPLWYVEAVRALSVAAPGDAALPELARVCVAIASAYGTGTRYGIGVDPRDGLVRAGEAGVQLTWMDAKVGDWVVTPRIGKAVEINALWYNSLRALAGGLAALAAADPAPYAVEADRVRAAFARFDGGHGGGLYDVLEGPGGDDPSLRPNQIFAASLPHSPLSSARAREIVALCGRELLTDHGLRSLAPSEPAYRGTYGGDQRSRDGSYHQGTVWPWLIGPFALAHFRAFGDAAAARAYLEPLLAETDALACGTLPEIADGDAPFRFDGAVAQAWSVAELLRAWSALAE